MQLNFSFSINGIWALRSLLQEIGLRIIPLFVTMQEIIIRIFVGMVDMGFFFF